LICLFLLSLAVAGCATYGPALQTQPAKDIDLSDTYTVIRVGGNYFEDYYTFALIVPENGKYRFNIFRPEFEYRSSKGLTAKQALSMAETFVAAQPNFTHSQTNAVMGPEGAAIAYEVRPLYQQILFGEPDILIVVYQLKADNIVEVRVDIDDIVKRRQSDGEIRRRGRR